MYEQFCTYNEKKKKKSTYVFDEKGVEELYRYIMTQHTLGFVRDRWRHDATKGRTTRRLYIISGWLSDSV